MPIIETRWGTIQPESTKDIKKLIDILEDELYKTKIAKRWSKIAKRAERKFTAVADKLSKDAVQPHYYTKAKLVFHAYTDPRSGQWVLGGFRRYEIDGDKYFAEPKDLPFGFDLNSIDYDWEGEKQYSSNWLPRVDNGVAIVYIVGNFSHRKMHQ